MNFQKMRKIVFFLSICMFLCSVSMLAQNSFCLTPDTSTHMTYNSLVSNFANIEDPGPHTLRVYFHVVNDGFNRSEVEQAFAILQEDYNPHNIFFEWDCYIDFIDASPYASSSIFNVNKHQDGIDIYLYRGPLDRGSANGVGESSEFYVSGDTDNMAVTFSIPLALTHVISHEMGHVLFLWHTHRSGTCEEYVDGSNCNVCGDLVCDTPSDPNILFLVDAHCNWLITGGTDSHGDPYDPDTQNIMSYTTASCMEYISNGQGQRARNAISLLQFLADCKVISAPHEIFNDTTISGHQAFQNDIIIHENVTLTITGSISMAQNKRILLRENAKLIVDGGTISNWCGGEWSGIKVTGGNPDFDVKFTSNATIENTNAAAVSMFAPLPWPQIRQFGNGILKADSTTFNNTKRIVEFISWLPLPNPSYIRNCIQNGGKWCITNWNCQGIDVRSNVFNNISDECIVTEMGSFSIFGNEFNSGQSDILFNNVSAGIATTIGSNVFKGENIGYNARGATIAQNKISNNYFQTRMVDVMIDGHHQFELFQNDFTGPFGTATFDSGGGIADLYDNNFSGNIAGALAIGNNKDYNFFKNCYSTLFFDNYIVGQISAVVHNMGSAANNCFTHDGNPYSVVQDIGGMPDPFVYLEPDDTIINCKDAILAHPNVIRRKNGIDIKLNCGSDLEIDSITEGSYCRPKRWIKDDVLDAYTWLYNQVDEIEMDAGLSDIQKERLLQIYERCFWRVRGYLFELYVKEGRYEDARRLYVGETHPDAKVYTFSSYIMENDLKSARLYLKSIGEESEEMQDFVTIQNINLDRLPNGPFYKASGSELHTVKNIALKSHPYAAYAKALYYTLTGEVISSQIPDIHGRAQPRTSSRSGNVKSSKSALKVYPNPFSNYLHMEITGYEAVKITITDCFGQSVFTRNTDESVLRIPTDTWSPGMYLIRIVSNGQVVLTDKILLLH